MRSCSPQRNAAFPYDGAKEHYILDIEDRDLLDALIPRLYVLIPQPKKK